MVEAAQRLQAASHAAVVLYDGLKGLSENKGNSGAGYVVTSACYLEVQGSNPAIGACNGRGYSEVASGITRSSGAI